MKAELVEAFAVIFFAIFIPAFGYCSCTECVVDLQSGFNGQKVVLNYNGKEIYSGTPQDSKIGLSEQFSFRVREDQGTLTVAQGQIVFEPLKIDWSHGCHLGISVYDEKLVHLQRKDGFVYD